MKLKRIFCTGIAAATLLGTTAMAKDNIYAYNKFVSTIIGPQLGYCDLSASFAGHESEYENVNDYFSGLISAFYDDFDNDLDNELVTVESRAVTVYQAEEKGVVYLDSIDLDLIADFGDSYANVFVAPSGDRKYIGVETYSNVGTTYLLQLHELSPETDELSLKLEIKKTSNEDGREENVWANGKSYYTFTEGGGLQSVHNPDEYENCVEAARTALRDVGVSDAFVASYDRLWFGGELNDSSNLTNEQLNKIERLRAEGNYRVAHIASGLTQETYIRATNLRFEEKPVVLFEDYSRLGELMIKPDIVTVQVDGEVLQFPTQDPMIVDNRTLVPMRTIFEKLGAQVDWIDEGGVQKIIANTADKNISMTINSNEFFVNGEKKELDVPAQLINDKTLVPLRAVSESLDCTVDWTQETKTVTIQSNNQ